MEHEKLNMTTLSVAAKVGFALECFIIFKGYNFLIWVITAAAGLAVIGWEMHPYTQLFYITVRVIIQYIPCWSPERKKSEVGKETGRYCCHDSWGGGDTKVITITQSVQDNLFMFIAVIILSKTCKPRY
jgi:hypothetical protein